ncbi:hypothetical protein DFH08DRAFT_674475, partial [Mycena albidolilacea]
PLPYYAADGNYYCIALFNRDGVDHISRAHNAAQDPAIQAVRVAMDVDQDPSLEGTLQWFRWPLTW